MNNAYYLEEPVTKGSFYFFAVKQTKKSDAKRHQTSNLLERVKGFEPSTHGLGSRYSTTELHPLGIMSEQSESACSDGFYYSSWGLKKQAAKQLLKKERKE